MAGMSTLSPPVAGALDLSRLPPFRLVTGTYESDKAAMLAGVTARMAARDIVFDATALESEPVTALIEEVAYRRAIDRAAVNDAGRSMTLAYAVGAALDHIAATYYADLGIRRLEDEDDDRFRRRIALAPEAASPFTAGAYVFAALSAGLDVADARALNHGSGLVEPGEILLVILERVGADPDEVLVLVRETLAARPIRAETDVLTVTLATRVVQDVAAVIEIPPGPDADLVLADATDRLAAHAGERRRIGLRVTRSGLSSALHVAAADNVRLQTPAAQVVDPGPAGVVELGEVTLTAERVDG